MVRDRGAVFAERPVTRIWQELPDPDNPYLVAEARCHGYALDALMVRCSYSDVLFLLLRGELPTPEQAALWQALAMGLINPGPRHPATRAAMNSGVSRTLTPHILPIALAVLGGEHQGVALVEEAIRFLRRESRQDPVATASRLLAAHPPGDPTLSEWPGAPGFGRLFGGIDPQAARLAARLLALPGAGVCLRWGQALATALVPDRLGWLLAGVTAAALADLGFPPRHGPGVMQLLQAPGLLAHGLEMANKPLTAMPFAPDRDYVLES